MGGGGIVEVPLAQLPDLGVAGVVRARGRRRGRTLPVPLGVRPRRPLVVPARQMMVLAVSELGLRRRGGLERVRRRRRRRG